MNSLLTTSRTIIQEPVLSDFDNLYALQTNQQVMSFTGNGVRSKDEVMLGLNKAIQHYQKHRFSLGCVYQKHSLECIGRAGLIYFEYNDKQANIELAYALLPQYWGNGYATEITKGLIQWGFEHLSLNKLIAVVHPDNIPSQNVLKKSGMLPAGTISYWNKEVMQFEIDAVELK